MPDEHGRPTLAENLNRLFDTIRPDGPKGRRYTNEEVASAIKQAEPGVRVGGAYLSALRKGTKRNPSTELLTALARFFGVPASYFLDEPTAAQTDAEIELARVAHNLGVRKLALRALELSPEGLAAVTKIVERVLEADPGARTQPPRSAQPPQSAPADTPPPGLASPAPSSPDCGPRARLSSALSRIPGVSGSPTPPGGPGSPSPSGNRTAEH